MARGGSTASSPSPPQPAPARNNTNTKHKHTHHINISISIMLITIVSIIHTTNTTNTNTNNNTNHLNENNTYILYYYEYMTVYGIILYHNIIVTWCATGNRVIITRPDGATQADTKIIPAKIVPAKICLTQTFRGIPYWAWEFHPCEFCLSQTLWNPESEFGDWPYAYQDSWFRSLVLRPSLIHDGRCPSKTKEITQSRKEPEIGRIARPPDKINSTNARNTTKYVRAWRGWPEGRLARVALPGLAGGHSRVSK